MNPYKMIENVSYKFWIPHFFALKRRRTNIND